MVLFGRFSKIARTGLLVAAGAVGLYAVARVAKGETVDFAQLTDPIWSGLNALTASITGVSDAGLKWIYAIRDFTGVQSVGHQQTLMPDYTAQWAFATREANVDYMTNPTRV